MELIGWFAQIKKTEFYNNSDVVFWLEQYYTTSPGVYINGHSICSDLTIKLYKTLYE